MRVHRLTLTSMLLVTFFVSTGFSQNIQDNHKLNSAKNAYLTLNKPILGKFKKTTGLTIDTMVVSKESTYNWNSTGWNATMVTAYTNNQMAYCSVIEQNNSKKLREYDPDGITIRELALNSNKDTIFSIIKTYPGYNQIVASPIIANSYFYLQTKYKNNFSIDSSVYIHYRYNDEKTGFDTSTYINTAYSKINQNTLFSITTTRYPTLTKILKTAYIQRYGSNEDTLQINYRTVSDATETLDTNLNPLYIISKYDSLKRITEVLTIENKMGKLRIYDKEIPFYNSNGLIDSLVMYQWDTLQSNWFPSEKAVFEYEKISLLQNTHLVISQQTSSFLRSNIKNGTLIIYTPCNIRINSVEIFDLQGKRIAGFHNTAQSNNPALFPLTSIKNYSLFLITINTTRGTFSFKESSPAMK